MAVANVSTLETTKAVPSVVPIATSTSLTPSALATTLLKKSTALTAISPICSPFSSQSTVSNTSEILATASRSAGAMLSYIVILMPSSLELSAVMSPLNVSFIVAAISLAVPSHPLSASSKSAVLSTPALSIRFNPLILSDVNVAISAELFSASPMPSVASSTSFRMSVRSLKLPSASCTSTLVSPIFIAPSFILLVMSRITAVRAVPASDPLRPWLAMLESSAVVVSTS